MNSTHHHLWFPFCVPESFLGLGTTLSQVFCLSPEAESRAGGVTLSKHELEVSSVTLPLLRSFRTKYSQGTMFL